MSMPAKLQAKETQCVSRVCVVYSKDTYQLRVRLVTRERVFG